MKPRVKQLLLNLLTVLVLLITIEVVARIILARVYNRSFDSGLLADNKYGNSTGLRENAEGRVWGKAFHTDEYGCRKNAVPVSKGKKKWLFIGDSVTEGVGVEDKETFSSLCSAELKDYSVMNYSLIGYSISDYRNIINSVVAHDSTVELVTVCFCLNDVYGPAKSSDLPTMARNNGIGALNAFLQEHCGTYKLLKLFMFRNSDRYYRYDRSFYESGNTYFTQAMSELQECDSVCKSNGIYFNVVMLPYRSQLTGSNAKDRAPQQLVAEYCFSNDIEFFDAAEAFREIKSPQDLYLFADEIHFSPTGHKALAQYLLE